MGEKELVLKRAKYSSYNSFRFPGALFHQRSAGFILRVNDVGRSSDKYAVIDGSRLSS